MSRAATIDFEHVSKRYPATGWPGIGRPGTDGTQPAPRGAVEDLTLHVPAGRICVLVGPSGCGKTTTLRLVNRLIEPTAGRILLDGVDVATREPTELRRGIGYVIQQVGLFPHQTIGANVATVPHLLGWPADRQRERTDELLALVGLDPATYRDRYPAQLSGGERQRVGVARALAADPPILLMDEPFGAVDPVVRDRLQNELLRIQADLAKTILFVTHDIDEAIKLGDLVAVMDLGGRLARFGTPDEILADPGSEFVARFVGADRGLKRLALARVGDLSRRPAPTVVEGDATDAARDRLAAEPFGYLLLVDREGRPIGWLGPRELDAAPDGPLGAGIATPMSPLLDRQTTLRDALAMLIDAEVQAGIVVDASGRADGLVTADDIIATVRRPDRAEARG